MIKYILAILLLASPVYGTEVLSSFDEENISVYNDTVRDITADISSTSDDIEEINTFLTGIIVMWSGAIADIPSGWVICDGTNGTPDLTDRFVLHADSDSGGTNDVGDTGGSSTMAHTHTIANSGYSIGTRVNGTLAVGWNTGGNYSAESLAGTVTSAAASNSENRPKFYALAYIQKT